MRRMRMLERPMVMVMALAVAVGMLPPVFAAEQRQVVISRSQKFRFGALSDAGAVTFIFRTDGSEGDTTPEFAISGYNATKNRIDGRNHDLDGNLVGSGDTIGLAWDKPEADMTLDGKVTITGSPATQYNYPTINVYDVIDQLIAKADITYTNTTTLNNENIGSAGNYKIVVVKNTKLNMNGNSAGYGILIMYDDRPGGGATLNLNDQASWQGVIVTYTGKANNGQASDKIKLQFGKTPSAGAAGTGARVLGSVICMGRQITVDFPTKSVADIYYSSAAVANVDDKAFNAIEFHWDDWRER